MIKNIWSVLCKRTILNSLSKNLTLVEVTEIVAFNINKEIEAKIKKSEKSGFIFNNFFIEIASFWTRSFEDVESFDVKIVIKDPRGKRMSQIEKRLRFGSKLLRHHSRILVRGLKVSIQGEYMFGIYVKPQGENEFYQQTSIPLIVKFKIKDKLLKIKVNDILN